jgi:hypothetical protein
MWCAHTRKPKTAMAMEENALAREAGDDFADDAH